MPRQSKNELFLGYSFAPHLQKGSVEYVKFSPPIYRGGGLFNAPGLRAGGYRHDFHNT